MKRTKRPADPVSSAADIVLRPLPVTEPARTQEIARRNREITSRLVPVSSHIEAACEADPEMAGYIATHKKLALMVVDLRAEP